MEEKENIQGFRPELLGEPYVQYLHKLIGEFSKKLEEQDKKLEELAAEIRRLKNLPKKPDIKPSRLDDSIEGEGPEEKKKRKGSEKRKKKGSLEIHEQKEIAAKDVPKDWNFVGYKNMLIQDFIIQANNIEYRLEIWKSPDGVNQIVADLPLHLQNTHFGPILKAYILHQYNECAVSQPLILTSLKDFGVDISSGQINAILTEGKEKFHKEKESLLAKGIELSEELRTDDTGARHAFKNGFCNCINSDLFTYFTTSYSKSRINFLEILRINNKEYCLTEVALGHVKKQGLSPKYYKVLEQSYQSGLRVFEDKSSLEQYFLQQGFIAKYAIKQITEALLIGTIVKHGFDVNTLIHSDGAGQFNLFVHSLCWKHAERPLIKLKSYNPFQQNQLDEKRAAFWTLYQDLKQYKINPQPKQAILLKAQFDLLCDKVTNFDSLNQILEELKKKKGQLLVVLKRPNTSLHNNCSESDIREYAKRRKISAGTRSENGRKARDTFLSLKKTCRKLEVSFWEYLLDRLQNKNGILPLSQIMAQKAALVSI